MNKLSIIGSGGHTRSSFNLLKKYGSEFPLEIYDDSYVEDSPELISGIKLSGKLEDIDPQSKIFLSIGDNKKREILFNKYKDRIYIDNIFHEKAFCESNVSIGIANQVFANVYINSFVKIGDNNIINTSAIIEHEVNIGSHNHISVGAKLCGRVKMGDRCMIGAGAIVIDKISICDDVIIGAGAVVVKNIEKSGTYVGNPARLIK